MKKCSCGARLLAAGMAAIITLLACLTPVYLVSAAGGFNCSVTDSCGGGNTTVLYLRNDTGGYWNAHAQNVSVGTYPYTICCNSTSSLSYACSEGVFLNLNDTSNTHVQRGDYAGPGIVYGINACLTATPGHFNCTYVDDACPADRECFASMASALPSENNDTDAHIGPCDEYTRKICCRIILGPIILYVAPTPGDNSHRVSNSETVNVTVASDSGVNVDTCILEWNGANETMTMRGSGASVTCDATKGTADGTTYTFTVYANDSVGNMANETTRTFRENDEPSHSIPVLNATDNPLNRTTANITCWNQSTSDADGDSVTNIYHWYADGKPVILLNMPFDNNVSSVAAGAVKDYSGFANGQLGGGDANNASAWIPDGRVGGAYDFDGSNDYILIGSQAMFNVPVNESRTLEAWIKGGTQATNSYFLWKEGGCLGWYLRLETDGDVRVNFNTGSGCSSYESYSVTVNDANYDDDQWHHVVDVIDRPNTNMTLYIDGVYKGSALVDNVNSSAGGTFKIGANWDNSAHFNGTIDEIRVYNRSLTAQQIYQLWTDKKDGQSNSQTIVSNETSHGESWICEVTPSDSYEDGNPENSSALTIENTPPEKVVLSSPANQSHITDRTPTFQWDIPGDADDDTLNYTINITCFGGCSDDNRLVTDIMTNSYVPATELEYFGDDNKYYNWSVRAGDGYEYGEWSDTWQLTVDTNVSIIMINNVTDFGGNRIPGYTDDTTDDDPTPFQLRNMGNCLIDVNISSSDLLWDSVSQPSDYFNYSVNWYSGEEGAFNWSGSQTSETNMPEVDQNVTFIDYLNYTSGNSTAEIDIHIEVPPGEPPGVKSSIIVFTGWYFV